MIKFHISTSIIERGTGCSIESITIRGRKDTKDNKFKLQTALGQLPSHSVCQGDTIRTRLHEMLRIWVDVTIVSQEFRLIFHSQSCAIRTWPLSSWHADTAKLYRRRGGLSYGCSRFNGNDLKKSVYHGCELGRTPPLSQVVLASRCTPPKGNDSPF